MSAHLRVIGEMDVLQLVARLRLSHWDKFAPVGDVDVIRLRDDGRDLPILRDWKTAESFLKRLKAEAAQFVSPVEIGAVRIERLNGETATPWTRFDDPEWLRVDVALASTAQAWLYCAGDGHIAPAGQVVYVDHHTLHCAVNFGHIPRIHLIAHVRRPPV